MKRSLITTPLLALALLHSACSKSPETAAPQAAGSQEVAIRAALDKYLNERSGLNVQMMEWNVTKLTVQGDRAEADVEFRAKEGGGSMGMHYEFERRDGVWTVLKRGGSPPHGEMPAAPEGAAAPPGHPPVAPPKKP